MIHRVEEAVKVLVEIRDLLKQGANPKPPSLADVAKKKGGKLY